MNSKALLIGIVALLFLAFSIWAIASSKQNKSTELVTLSTSGQKVGSDSAKVTLVEFGDYQCPACKAYEQTLSQVKEAYKKDLLFVFKHYPLPGHKNAFPAALAAEAAARQNKFWEYHGLLYENQEEWASLPNPQEKFIEYAGELELDTTQFEKDLGDKKLGDIINAQKDEGGKVGVNATPTFYLNGKYLEVSNTFESFKKAIDTALGK